MCAWDLGRERIRLENTLNHTNSDFCATFMTVNELNLFAQSHPDNVRLETISTLEKILKDLKHLKQTQSIFLYRAATDALSSIIVNNADNSLSLPAISALKNILNTGMDVNHRAAAEAMGLLPLCIKDPEIDEERTEVIPSVKWEEILIQNSFNLRRSPIMIGRSLVSAIDGNQKLLVLKLALSKNSIESLNKEACWMKYLSSNGNPFSVEFRIPFQLKIICPLCFYFTTGYNAIEDKIKDSMNGPGAEGLTPGFIHAATQILDRPTDIRDFKHFITFESKSQKLYEHIGSHILSIMLVIGSYFRNHEAEKSGLDEQGKPVDARQLFDKSFFKELIRGVFHKYYNDFFGSNFNGDTSFDFDELAKRMIEEMGVDRHMEEILRAADQTEMTDREFKEFLLDREYSKKKYRKTKKRGERHLYPYRASSWRIQ